MAQLEPATETATYKPWILYKTDTGFQEPIETAFPFTVHPQKLRNATSVASISQASCKDLPLSKRMETPGSLAEFKSRDKNKPLKWETVNAAILDGYFCYSHLP